MKIFVTAKPSAHEERVVQVDDSHFEISVKEPPVQGRANTAIARALASHLGIPASRVKLVSGFSSRKKVFSADQ
ncbi:MAG: DUF167 domain-containing protein [Minisyncoccia bacterium]|jgi:uncharacterized protein YggU (UPF0235/DUF167 family)